MYQGQNTFSGYALISHFSGLAKWAKRCPLKLTDKSPTFFHKIFQIMLNSRKEYNGQNTNVEENDKNIEKGMESRCVMTT